MRYAFPKIGSPMWNDAQEAAFRIIGDMRLKPGQASFDWIAFHADRLGGFTRADMDGQRLGYCVIDTGEIVIEKSLSGRKAAEVLAHETAHRMCFSERYAEFNAPRFAAYDFLTFHELVAVIVHLSVTVFTRH